MRKQPHRYWHKGIPADLKIIIFILVMAMVMSIVYLAVDQAFSSVSNREIYNQYQGYKDTFTKQPTEEPNPQPAAPKTEEQKEAERNAKDPGYLGYVHPLIIGLFFGIIAITILGFILYAILDKLGTQKE